MKSERTRIPVRMLLIAAAPLLAFCACRKEPAAPAPKAGDAAAQPAPAEAQPATAEAQPAGEEPAPDVFQFPEPEPFQAPEITGQEGQPAYAPESQAEAPVVVPAADPKTDVFPVYGLDSQRKPIEPPRPQIHGPDNP